MNLTNLKVAFALDFRYVSYKSCEVELTIAHAGGQQSGGELRFEKQK